MNAGEILQIAGALTGIGGLIGGLAALVNSRTQGVGTLSKAEAEFRRDLMTRLSQAETSAADAAQRATQAQADAASARADLADLLRRIESCHMAGCPLQVARLRQQGAP